jgi:hypothetical protein
MTKTHKDVAVFMVQLSENEGLSEQQVVREIADKTRELLNQLRFVVRRHNAISNVAPLEPWDPIHFTWVALICPLPASMSTLLYITNHSSHATYPSVQKVEVEPQISFNLSEY